MIETAAASMHGRIKAGAFGATASSGLTLSHPDQGLSCSAAGLPQHHRNAPGGFSPSAIQWAGRGQCFFMCDFDGPAVVSSSTWAKMSKGIRCTDFVTQTKPRRASSCKL